ncbi:hypothetical protein AB3D20_002569 [Vibrio alginolyticus]|nr:conserved hypothetical protein [Vibrio parahaemolyticus AN-5034]
MKFLRSFLLLAFFTFLFVFLINTVTVLFGVALYGVIAVILFFIYKLLIRKGIRNGKD